MIKVGTVFSGIGAVEHALERLHIPYEIEFACDNGDVDILTKKISDNLTSIEEELTILENKVSEEYRANINRGKNELAMITEYIENADVNEKEITRILSEYSQSDFTNDNQKRAYATIINSIETLDNANDIKLRYMKLSVKLESDIKRSNLIDEDKLNLTKHLKEYNSYYKKIIKYIKLLSESLEMIHERIISEHIRNEVFSLDTLEAQKNYVDDLYKDHLSKNKVRTSYLANYDISEDRFHWNVTFLDGRKFHNKIDLFVGGSPCQSFSLVGKQRGLDDTRGTLFYEYARLVKEIQPKIFIYENVRALLSNDNGETWKTVSAIFDNLGYNWSYKILNAKNYGIPQNRERIFVVGFRPDLEVTDFEFPQEIELKKTMKDFLLDNAPEKYFLPAKGIAFVTQNKNLEKKYTQINGDIQLCQKKNQQFNWHGDFVCCDSQEYQKKLKTDLDKYFLSDKVRKYVLSSGTKGFYSKPEIDLDIARPLLQSMHKMHRAGVDNYVTSLGRLRKLTPRECLRLMGFCDSFKIVVADTPAYQQSGNSIVVDVLMHILTQISKVYPLTNGGTNNA